MPALKKNFVLLIALPLLSLPAAACPFCNRETTQAIYNSQFYPNLLTMLSAFIVLSLIVAILSALSAKRYRRRAASDIALLTPVPLTTASMVIGIGMGGFLDGIVLHQILQWHEMLSNKIPTTTLTGKTVNMFWDGVFHAFCLIVALTGIILLWRLLKRNDINRSGYLLSGGMLLGWGLFNIVEGIIDHHWLKLHNVRELSSSPEGWNIGFLAVSVGMLVLGYALVRRSDK